MPTLLNTLQGHDLTYIRMVANAWGVELNAPDAHKARPIVLKSLTDPNLILEMINSLPSDALDTLKQLRQHKGYLPWAQFSRDYGDVRVMGAARRDRERPDQNPESPVEYLWYRALIGRAFLSLNNEPQEYAYIPEEFLEYIPEHHQELTIQPGRPASPGEKKHQYNVSDTILNDAATLLAGYRVGLTLTDLIKKDWEINPHFLSQLLIAGNILDPLYTPNTNLTRQFLGQNRAQSIAYLVNSWLNASTIHEFFYTPSLIFENEPDIDSKTTRKFILDKLSQVPQNTWWNLDSFIQFFHVNYPDFLRPAGDYDSWFIREPNSENHLRGFQNWEKVEGRFLRYFITHTLYWLGLVDLASSENAKTITAFKLSDWSTALWNGHPPELPIQKTEKIQLDRYGNLKVPDGISPAIRYQIARFCEWDDKQNKVYLYHLSPRSLKIAAEQGLKISHLFTLLQNQLKDPFPPSLKTALTQWEQTQQANQISRESILRVSDPDILNKLQSERAGRYIKEILSPTTAIIRSGQEELLQKALIDLGSMTDFDIC